MRIVSGADDEVELKRKLRKLALQPSVSCEQEAKVESADVSAKSVDEDDCLVVL
jgi:hypothetical protein